MLWVGGAVVVLAIILFFAGCNTGRPAPGGSETANVPAANVNVSAKTNTNVNVPAAPPKTGGTATAPSNGSGNLPSAQGSDVTGKIGPEPGF